MTKSIFQKIKTLVSIKKKGSIAPHQATAASDNKPMRSDFSGSDSTGTSPAATGLTPHWVDGGTGKVVSTSSEIFVGANNCKALI